MKYITILFLLAMQTCKTTDNSNFTGKLMNTDNAKLQVVDCPKNGTCTLKILKNKEIRLQKDGIGKMYPKIVAGNNIVVIYTFKKGNPNGYQDGNESETIHFEIKSDTSEKLVNEDLKKINLIFGKHCFCRDISGYYVVNTGSFIMKSSKKNDKIELFLDFSIPEVGDRQYVKTVALELN